MMNKQVIDEALGETRVNAFSLSVLLWCSFLMVVDGYDLVIYGSVLPQLMKEWDLSSETAGMIGSSALFGMMIGALTLGASSDRFGRRRIILVSVVIFSVAMLANGMAENTTQFTICRFLTGFGIGGLSPNIISLLTEMSPRHKRNLMVTLMLSCFSIGGILAALIGKVVTPAWGWQANFFISGISLVALPFLYRYLPESVAFLLLNRRCEEAEPLLRRLSPGFKGDVRLLSESVISEAGDSRRSRSATLFANGHARNTLLVWVAFGVCMFMVYGLSTWLPKLLTTSGYSLGSSLGFFITLNVGAFIGGLASGWLADKWGGGLTLVLFFLVATLSISALGYPHGSLLLNTFLLLAGATTIGTLCIVHAFAAQLYPNHVRSTGLGFAGAVGRLGAVAGPAVGGYLLALQLPTQYNFLAFALPGILGALAVSLIVRRSSPVRGRYSARTLP